MKTRPDEHSLDEPASPESFYECNTAQIIAEVDRAYKAWCQRRGLDPGFQEFYFGKPQNRKAYNARKHRTVAKGPVSQGDRNDPKPCQFKALLDWHYTAAIRAGVFA